MVNFLPAASARAASERAARIGWEAGCNFAGEDYISISISIYIYMWLRCG